MEIVKMERHIDCALLSALRSVMLCGTAGQSELRALRAIAEATNSNPGDHQLARGALAWLEGNQKAA